MLSVSGWFYTIYEKNRDVRDQFPATAEELRTRLSNLHQAAKEGIAQSRALNRRAKKKRKRKVAQGVVSLSVGTGAIIANTNMPALAPYSYVLGCGALLQAARDLVGEPPD